MSNSDIIETIDKLIESINDSLELENFTVIDDLLKTTKFTSTELDLISNKIRLLIKSMEAKRSQMLEQQIDLVKNSYAYKQYSSNSLN